MSNAMSPAMSPAALKQRTRAAEKSTTGRVFELLYARLVYVAFMLQLRLLCRLPIVGSVATLVLSSRSCAAPDVQLPIDRRQGSAARLRRPRGGAPAGYVDDERLRRPVL